MTPNIAAPHHGAITSTWQQALDFNAEILESKQVRGASALDIASFLFNDYFPLLQLRRYQETRTLLLRCCDVFERENSIEMLGDVLSALAGVEDKLSGLTTARRLEEAALRYQYIQLAPSLIATSHFNLTNYLTSLKAAWHQIMAHRLAAD